MEPGFWDDPQNAQRILQQAKQVKEKIQRYEDLYQKYEELNFFLEMAMEEGEESVEQEILQGLKQLEKEVEELKVETL
ncbi:MAG TPA: PCRF domain-containing protein, partial [Clostridiales bacterium]|nr:PCRF domain-containing protein [Clostridiales bacterium]